LDASTGYDKPIILGVAPAAVGRL